MNTKTGLSEVSGCCRARLILTLAIAASSVAIQGCATPKSPSPTQEIESTVQTRSTRDILLFGPTSFNRVAYRLPWMATVGLVTLPVWFPWAIYEASAVGVAGGGDLVTVVSLREGVVRFESGSPLIDQEVPSVNAIPPNVDFGRYHALIVGNNNYEHLKKLNTAVSDAEQLSSLLRDSYGFETTVLRNATRGDLISALFKLRETLGPGDNLLIYYAGHGQLDPDTEEGYWLPIDAREHDPAQWVANSTISTMLKGIHAKHIIVIADSCFAGSLNRSVFSTRRSRDFLTKMVTKRARVVMTSGGLEPVTDTGDGGNSVFAKYLLQALRENFGVIDSSSLFLRIRKPVAENAYQTPEYGPIRFTGHEGGDFFFVRRVGVPARKRGAVPGDVPGTVERRN